MYKQAITPALVKARAAESSKDTRENNEEVVELAFPPSRGGAKRPEAAAEDVKRLLAASAAFGTDFDRFAEFFDDALLTRVDFSDHLLVKHQKLQEALAEGDRDYASLVNRGGLGDGCTQYLLQYPLLYAHAHCPRTSNFKKGAIAAELRQAALERSRSRQANLATAKKLSTVKKQSCLVPRKKFATHIAPFLQTILAPKESHQLRPGTNAESLPPVVKNVVQIMMHYDLTFRSEKHTVWRAEEEKEEEITRHFLEPALDALGGNRALQWRTTPPSSSWSGFTTEDKTKQLLKTAVEHAKVQAEDEHRRERDGAAVQPAEVQQAAGKKRKEVKDFFHAVRPTKRSNQEVGTVQRLIEYEYLEGHTNAVRRPVFLDDLLLPIAA
jgi:hypothetical protein